MKGLYKYLLVLLVTVCYIQAAFELNVGPIVNTYGDVFDTYVQAEDRSPSHSQKYEKSIDFAELPAAVTFEKLISLPSSNNTDSVRATDEPYRKRWYIFLCKLLI